MLTLFVPHIFENPNFLATLYLEVHRHIYLASDIDLLDVSPIFLEALLD